MTKHTLLLFAGLAIAGLASGQNARTNEKPVTDIYSPLKPADGSPAVFSTKAELDAKVQDKKQGLLALIKENSADPAKVKQYREQLWRLEHAIVVEAKDNK